MAAAAPSPEATIRLQELESVTRCYARYSRSAGGLGSVLGGLLCLVAYLTGGLLPLTLPLRVVLMAIPFLWLLAKGGLTRFYYQRFGHVEEQISDAERRRWGKVVRYSVLIAIMIVAGALVNIWPNWELLVPNGIEYIVLVLMIPVSAVFWMRSRLDFIVGTFLFCQAAVVCGGFTYPLPGTTHTLSLTLLSLITLMFPVAALYMIRAGILDHKKFRSVVSRMEELRRAMAATV